MSHSTIRALAASIAALFVAACQSVPPIATPAAAANQRRSADAPMPQSVTLRTNVSNGIATISVVPDFRFIAPNGNAMVLRRELVSTNAAIAQTQISNATINIPSEAQEKGAVISGGWNCGVAQYYVRLRAYIIDADGNRSNAIEYTIHCNGG
jgi:hypothetical protein